MNKSFIIVTMEQRIKIENKAESNKCHHFSFMVAGRSLAPGPGLFKVVTQRQHQSPGCRKNETVWHRVIVIDTSNIERLFFLSGCYLLKISTSRTRDSWYHGSLPIIWKKSAQN